MVFPDFFAELRRQRVPVSFGEWMMLLKLMYKGGVEPTLESFYQVSRAVLVKDEAYYDRFDRAFAISFKNAEPPEELIERIIEAMKKEYARVFTEEEMAALKALPFDQIMKNFREQLEAERFKEHEGGNRAIGRRGTSTQGADGYNEAGVRIGQSDSRHKKAVQIAEYRRFRNYDKDRVLDTRGMRVAVSKLRRMLPEGPQDELDIDETIDKTARNGGEIEMAFRAQKRNTQRILLLTDVGGSMSGYAQLVSRFFSAMSGEIKNLEHYYFHNCPYDVVFQDAARRDPISSQEVIEKYKSKYMLVMVGDAAMAPTELMHAGGAIDLYVHNERPGIEHLQDFRMAFEKSAWLNPEPQRLWDLTQTIQMVKAIFPMFPLTQDGIIDAVEHLMGRRRKAA